MLFLPPPPLPLRKPDAFRILKCGVTPSKQGGKGRREVGISFVRWYFVAFCRFAGGVIELFEMDLAAWRHTGVGRVSEVKVLREKLLNCQNAIFGVNVIS